MTDRLIVFPLLLLSRLDNFWMFQDVKYDYTVNLAGTGDRSEYDSESY